MKRLVQSTLNKFGFRIVRIQDGPRPSDGLTPFFSCIKRLGFTPRHIMDVGANHGIWTREALKHFPDASYTLVEPQDQLKASVQDLIDAGCKIRWINAGAGDKSGTLPFTITPRDYDSTFTVTAEEARDAGLRQIPVEVKTLNEIVSTVNMPLPEMVKIDAEGFDLKVLRGASDLFGKTEIFLAEASTFGTYQNPLVEVLDFMADAGYRLFDITDLNHSPKCGILWLCELAFLRNASPLLNGVISYS